MSSRLPLAPVSDSSSNSRTSLGVSRAVAKKPIGPPSSTSSASQNGVSRKSLGGSGASKPPVSNDRRSIMPSQPQSRISLSTNARPSVARQSLNTARPSMAGNRRNSRGSIAPTGSRDSLNRRTSLYGQTDIQFKETRPIKDRNYIASTIAQIESFLLDHQYDKAVSQQMLLSPPSKEFFLMIEFLLRHIDPSFAFKDAKKPEEEVPVLFKALKYPFSMSARSLHSVGTPHAWPTFLAALHWLTRLLNYDEIAQIHRQEMMADDGAGQDALRYTFFDFVSNSYAAFMAYDDNEKHLEEEFGQTLLDRNAERKESINRLKEHTKQTQEQCETLRTQDSRVHNLKKALEESHEELSRVRQELQKVNEKNEADAKVLQELKSFRDNQRKAVAILQESLKEIEVRLQWQAEQNLDMERLTSERQQLIHGIEIAQNHRNDIEQSKSVIEMEVSEKFRDVERGVMSLNQLIVSTGLLSVLGAELRVTPQSQTILSMDLKKLVKPVLKGYLADQRKQHELNQPELVEIQTKADQRHSELNTKRTIANELKAKLSSETEELSNIQAQEPKREIESQVASIDREIERTANSDRESIVDRETRLRDIQRRVQEAEVAHEKEEQELVRLLLDYTEWIAQHKDSITERITGLNLALLEEVEASKPSSSSN